MNSLIEQVSNQLIHLKVTSTKHSKPNNSILKSIQRFQIRKQGISQIKTMSRKIR